VNTAWLSPGLGTVASLLLSSRLYGRPPSFTVSGSSELRFLELRGLVPSLAFTAGGESRPALKDFIVGYYYPPKSLSASNLRNVSVATLDNMIGSRSGQRLRYRNTTRSSMVMSAYSEQPRITKTVTAA
jgi:hypothetical protein